MKSQRYCLERRDLGSTIMRYLSGLGDKFFEVLGDGDLHGSSLIVGQRLYTIYNSLNLKELQWIYNTIWYPVSISIG